MFRSFLFRLPVFRSRMGRFLSFVLRYERQRLVPAWSTTSDPRIVTSSSLFVDFLLVLLSFPRFPSHLVSFLTYIHTNQKKVLIRRLFPLDITFDAVKDATTRVKRKVRHRNTSLNFPRGNSARANSYPILSYRTLLPYLSLPFSTLHYPTPLTSFPPFKSHTQH